MGDKYREWVILCNPKHTCFPCVFALLFKCYGDKNLVAVKSNVDNLTLKLSLQDFPSSSNLLFHHLMSSIPAVRGMKGSSCSPQKAYCWLPSQDIVSGSDGCCCVPLSVWWTVLCSANKDSLDWGLSIFCGSSVLILLECWPETFAVCPVSISLYPLAFEVGKRGTEKYREKERGRRAGASCWEYTHFLTPQSKTQIKV